jgi:hypothetical protein
MAEIKDFGNLFRLDGKIAVVTGGMSFPFFSPSHWCLSLLVEEI